VEIITSRNLQLEILDGKKLQLLSLHNLLIWSFGELKKTTKTNAILHLQQTELLTNFPPASVTPSSATDRAIHQLSASLRRIPLM
jgi:hypothetical protein